VLTAADSADFMDEEVNPVRMDERKARILQAIILDYIATAEPIGSRTISKKYDLGVSPATVRNEMSDLEDLGLIEQPYTSAGRIPSQKGYRYYVDFLMEKSVLSQDVKTYIRNMLHNQIKEAEIAAQTAIRLLSQFTNYTAMVLMPAMEHCTLQHVQLFPLGDGQKVVLVIVLDNGHVEHRTVDMSAPMTAGELAAATDVLNRGLRGLTVEQWKKNTLKQIYQDLDSRKAFLSEVMELLESILLDEYEHKLLLGGSLKFLNQPEFKNIEKVKELLALLEEHQVMREALSLHKDEKGVFIRIGDENIHEGMKGCSLIMTTYEIDGLTMGTMGVLGPVRMDYSKSIGMMEFITHVLAEKAKQV
jgi:heat-inducible transcriptional repressor